MIASIERTSAAAAGMALCAWHGASAMNEAAVVHRRSDMVGSNSGSRTHGDEIDFNQGAPPSSGQNHLQCGVCGFVRLAPEELGIGVTISGISGFAPDVGMNHHYIAQRQLLRFEELLQAFEHTHGL